MSDAPDAMTEMLARMWMTCDPNRGGIDPDEKLPMTVCSGGSDLPTIEHPNPLGGKPHWHWFIPRAEATKRFLKERGYQICEIQPPT